MIALGNHSHVRIWKDTFNGRQNAPYMSHEMPGAEVRHCSVCCCRCSCPVVLVTQQTLCVCVDLLQVEMLRFRPFDDVLAVGSNQGLQSLVSEAENT